MVSKKQKPVPEMESAASVRFRAESSYVDVDDDTANNRSTEMHSEYSRDNSRSHENSKSMEFTTASSDHFTANHSHKRTSSYSAASKWRSESRWVRLSKYGVLVFLAVTCAGCATGMYFLTKASEAAHFAEEFDDAANELIAISYQEANNFFDAVESFGATLTSYAMDTQNDFPFVTIPHFAHRGQNLRSITGATFLSWNPFVDPQNVAAWTNYTRQEAGWIQDGLDAQAKREGTQPLLAKGISTGIFQFDSQDYQSDLRVRVPDTSNTTKLVTWQVSPVPQDPNMVNHNLFSTSFGDSIDDISAQAGRLSNFITDPSYLQLDEKSNMPRPQSYLAQPIYRDFQDAADTSDSSSSIVGYVVALLPWDNFFRNIISDGLHSLDVVLSNDCGGLATLQVRGHEVTVISDTEDVHDPQFDSRVIQNTFGQVPFGWASDDDEGRRRLLSMEGSKSYWCTFKLAIYPTEEFEAQFDDDETIFYPVGIVVIFIFTTAVFLLHDTFIARRQARIEESAVRSNAIVQSLFPAQVRERLLMGHEEKAIQHITKNDEEKTAVGDSVEPTSTEPAIGLEDDDLVTDRLLRTKPIADLFPNATVMFADICGFTAWSSVREPTQVFTLLEQIYNSFDILARKRRVFKVETIGDCYVAAAGLPDPRPDHAVAMCRFANECLIKMHSVVKKLEVRLGPDTAELGMRFGLHSGPVTAGVLRGEKSRFQLFGDTVNTASRIETTGERNRVHLSEDTARILIQSGKESWVERRDGVVAAKGKGDMVTYWLTLAQSKLKKRKQAHEKDKMLAEAAKLESTATALGEPLSLDIPERSISLNQHISYDDRKQRLIDWNVDVLTTFLKKIQAMRSEEDSDSVAGANFEHDSWRYAHDDTTVLDEVREIITLPQEEQVYKRDPQNLELGEKAMAQLKEYVGLIASMYHENSFHNFKHASHVTQSVAKLLSRIVTADDIDYNAYQYKKKGNISHLHKHTYGITSDPITQFACAFSALIHDVDHSGVPNAQLIKEESDVALFYKNKSVAEQNSVDLAWSLLMEPEFDALRSYMYRDKEELDRFRQLVVNSVMATDIADRELGAARKARWSKAFAHHSPSDDESVDTHAMVESRIDSTNRKATIVIEHLIQASDVSHTMQHWHVYSKWNEKLFHEMYGAFKNGRSDKDPAEFWYAGELGFFDFYIIPLAKKLKECGVFGVASDEYLNYAEANREEWERKGMAMVEKYLAAYDVTTKTT